MASPTAASESPLLSVITPVFNERFTLCRLLDRVRHTVGNRVLTLLSNLCTDLNLIDMETYKVFRTDVLRRLHLVSDRSRIEPEITGTIALLGCRIYEVPSAIACSR